LEGLQDQWQESHQGGFSKGVVELQLEGVDCFPAVMANFSSEDEIRNLRQRLREIKSDFADFEEELILYPFVVEHLQRAGIDSLKK